MFPIVFAAISGRSMKMIARYLAEKGAKISVRLPMLALISHKLPLLLKSLRILIVLDSGATHG